MALVVNIGSGVSIVKVCSESEYQRVGGISVGGGTFIGLCRLLTGTETFQECLDLAQSGDATNVDLLVRDIYGGDYDSIGLSGDTVASSFGKIQRLQETGAINREDSARSLLVMVTYIIASLANLYAHKIIDHHGLDILYVGNFLYGNDISKKKLAYATNYWSRGRTPALFLKHEGFFGAIGALC